jgi:hypothetical protein
MDIFLLLLLAFLVGGAAAVLVGFVVKRCAQQSGLLLAGTMVGSVSSPDPAQCCASCAATKGCTCANYLAGDPYQNCLFMSGCGEVAKGAKDNVALYPNRSLFFSFPDL